MAIFKVAKRRVNDVRVTTWDGYDCEPEDEEICKYTTPEDLETLIFYCIKNASYILPVNVEMYSPEAVASQFLYIQKCSGEQLDTKAYHYILSFDTQKYEEFVSEDDIKTIMILFANEFLQGHQAILCLHTNKKSHYHVHIVVDPVNFCDYRKFSNNVWLMQRKLAFEILNGFHVALQGVSYYNENGFLKCGKEYGMGQYQYMLGKKYYL